MSTGYLPGRRVPQRALTIKPGAPGAAVTWTEDGVTRSGVVWALAPAPRCAWVTPDDGGEVLCLRLEPDGARGARADLGVHDWPQRLERSRLIGAAGYCAWARKTPGYVVTLHLPTCAESEDHGRVGAAKATAWALDPARRYLPELIVGLSTRWCPECLLGERDDEATS